ncbi:MAG: hypothetical protein AB8G22_09000 [Saprospiraceae bacterium]
MNKILSYEKILLLLPLVGILGCVTPVKFDTTTIERTTFDDLVLQPAHDLYDYRFEIIRQAKEVGDSCTTTENVDYPS